MDIANTTALATMSTAVMNSLNSKLLAVRKTFQACSCPGSMPEYGEVEKGDTSIITMVGSLDVNVAAEFHRLLINRVAEKKNIIICMSDVLRLDSAGPATLLDVYATANSHALGFTLAAVSLNAMHTIKLCCLDRVLPMCASIADAERYIVNKQDRTPLVSQAGISG